jgi:unsaturated rhamnogalacturonyl hydrolase
LTRIFSVFVTLERYLRNAKTGLFCHGFDEKHQEKWANPKTGVSAAPWGVTTGLYPVAVVDTLERLPAKHPGRGDLRNILVRLAKAVASVQDAHSGVFWQVLDAPKRGKNYLEASSSLLVYALAPRAEAPKLPVAMKPEAPKAEPAKPEAPKPPAPKPEPAKPAPAPATSAAPAPKPPSSAAPAAT